ncbi:hypothetical protein [Georgenia sp. H159]|uniref:hypothetical protein n=1 Tax=Georgenia sp. H159 TaxID=3076115 RepID=UPI002D78F11E|nr:hypothetical protein [Georgenia sp. H159]
MVIEFVAAVPVAEALAKAAGSAAVSAFARSRGADEHAYLLKVVARAIVEEKRGDDYAVRTKSGWHVLHVTGVAARRGVQGTKDGVDRTRIRAALAQLDRGLLARQPYSYVPRVSFEELLPALDGGANSARAADEAKLGDGSVPAELPTFGPDAKSGTEGSTPPKTQSAAESRPSSWSRLGSKVAFWRSRTTDDSASDLQRRAETMADPTAGKASYPTSSELSLEDLRQRFRDPFTRDLGVWLLALLLACRESRHSEARKALSSAGVPVEEWIYLVRTSTPIDAAGRDTGDSRGRSAAGVGVAWLLGMLSRILGYVAADRRLSQLAARRQENVQESRHIELVGVQTRRARAVERLVWAAAVVAVASATVAALLAALALGLLDPSI